MINILIVEDDPTFSRILRAWFSKRDFGVETATNGSLVRKKMKENSFDAVICDLRLPGEDGLSILEWIKKEYKSTVVIMMTGYADIKSAVMAMKLGAADYIPKPFNPEELFIKLQEAIDKGNNTTQAAKFESAEGISIEHNNESFIEGQSPVYRKLYEFINLVGPTKMSVLIEGDSGVGKEHIARQIHEKSERANGPFVAVDCGVISKELAASDFFGHIKGAFTGAIANKTGYFLNANNGTLFLDEIGNLSIEIQTQLLRALQEQRIKPVGVEKEIEIDVRIIAATNEDIEFAVKNGYFRNDLYHRISEFSLRVPSLKDSREDIPLFLEHFLKLANKALNKNIEGFTPEAFDILTRYDWPGNIRELKNIINRLTLISQNNLISADDIPDYFKNNNVEENLYDNDNAERNKIIEGLKFTDNNFNKTAELLHIDTKILLNKIKYYNIEI